MLESIKRKRSWVTQRLANRFPPWSRLRQLAQSTGQQLLEPAGQELEDLYWEGTYNLWNELLITSDTYQIQRLRKLSLPSTIEFRTVHSHGQVEYLEPTLVRGQLDDDSWLTLSLATNNNLQEFWYGVPSRITASGESYTYTAILPTTQVGNLSGVSPATITVPGRLWVTLSNSSATIQNYRGRLLRAAVVLEGIDIHGKEVKEKVKFVFDGKIQTEIAWSELETISTEYIEETAYIRVDWLPIGSERHVDTFGLHVSPNREKFRFYTLDSRSWGSTLKHTTFASDDFYSVEEGSNEEDNIYEIELLDSSGSNFAGNWMCQWPKRRYLIITTGSQLHFFIPSIDIGDRSPSASRDTEVILGIETDYEWMTRDDTITLDYSLKRPLWHILKTRWSVTKPDGTRVGIDPDGTEIAYSYTGWVQHAGIDFFGQLGYQGKYIDYLLDQRGQYIFKLETMMKDNATSMGNPFEQVDIKIVNTAYNTALSSVTLPASVGTITYVAFDAYQRPWVINSSGTAFRLNFHYDTYLVDYNDKLIYVREDYDQLEVTV